MKRILAFFLALGTAAGLLTGCGHSPAGGRAADAPRLRIVATIFPAYDWVRQILGEAAEGTELTLLLDSGVDLHSYQPSAEDLARISGCDLFVCVGGESDGWVDDALRQADAPGRKVIRLLDLLEDSALPEECKPGMQPEPAAEGDEAAGEGPERDEHVWLSLKNARFFCERLADALAQLDTDRGDEYRANAAAYAEALDALDGEYRQAVDGAAVRTLLFADRFPFRYLTEDYGLDYYAAFAGCSAESEASFETVSFLARKADELRLTCVLTIEGGGHGLAETVVRSTRAKDLAVLTLDSMQGTTARDVENGATYLAVMEQNLRVLRQALR